MSSPSPRRHPRPPARAWPTRRQANLLLAVLVLASLLTGTWLFGAGAVGSWWVRALAIAHGVLGLGLLALAPRKRRTVASGLRRGRASRWASILLLLAAVLTVVTGLGHSAGWRRVAGTWVLHVHVVAGIATGVLVTWHALARPARPVMADASRRSVLRAGAVGLVSAAGWALVEGAAVAIGLPGADRRLTGSHELSSGDPDGVPGTIWLDDRVPDLDPRTWRLAVGAPDDRRRRLVPLEELRPTEEWTAVLDCTSGWWTRQVWGGVPLVDLLGPRPDGARSVLVTSATGYPRRFPPEDVERLLVATEVGGGPIAVRHGAPARLVAPGRRGFWWVKWLAEVRWDPAPPWAQPPFPLT